MIPLLLSTSPSSSASLCFKPFFLNKSLTYTPILHFKKRKRRKGICRAEFSLDAPIGAAIGATILYSLLFPVTSSTEDDAADSVIDSSDARFAVMGIISFLPYFNWLSWLFAWLDTGKQRYAVYAIVYLAPYLRPGLSISPEESWLPIASMILCIIHIQLEASVKNGDIQGLRFFSEVQNQFASSAKEDHEISKENGIHNQLDLPPGRKQATDEMQNWTVSRNHSEDSEILDDDEKEGQ